MEVTYPLEGCVDLTILHAVLGIFFLRKKKSKPDVREKGKKGLEIKNIAIIEPTDGFPPTPTINTQDGANGS